MFLVLAQDICKLFTGWEGTALLCVKGHHRCDLQRFLFPCLLQICRHFLFLWMSNALWKSFWCNVLFGTRQHLISVHILALSCWQQLQYPTLAGLKLLLTPAQLVIFLENKFREWFCLWKWWEIIWDATSWYQDVSSICGLYYSRAHILGANTADSETLTIFATGTAEHPEFVAQPWRKGTSYDLQLVACLVFLQCLGLSINRWRNCSLICGLTKHNSTGTNICSKKGSIVYGPIRLQWYHLSDSVRSHRFDSWTSLAINCTFECPVVV